MTSTLTPSASAKMGGTVHSFQWNWQGQPLTVVYEVLGSGTPVLLLPAFSTVSTRAEVGGLANELQPQFQTVALDWPGFGESDRQKLEYQPALYHQLLHDFIQAVFNQPMVVVAAGHAAGYAVRWAATQPDRCSKLVLVAPTWRGPLAVMGLPESVRTAVRQTVRSPLVGQTLYKLNTAPSFLKLMYRRHVYVDAERLTPEFIEQKYDSTQQPGARFAPAAFVTGGLDPVDNQTDFLAMMRSIAAPKLVVIGEQAPPRSKAEMEAIAQLADVASKRLPGSLGIHEEYAVEVAGAIRPFLLA
ncbi:alpha/beta hydrolase [Oculatella sp. LEGE 06141]|uniref:alpha/beta fold hydrolase n=1 Tax=Oculatella sp. LEGE 06141 TaxID=1828648 RepID=UPI00187DF11A|nr:alpha/beta hydrolase [Oculatella sp. LEGE 06141]MBE9178283.1 alpha/beta hydrolase [Oculatella sp. LEGE 06141]